jgi:hypothetical protein
MRTFRITVAVLGAAFVVLAYSGQPAAFHSGGVAECVGCHSMHNPAQAGNTGNFLLVKVGATATCLSCHESATDTGPNGYHVSTPTAKLGPGASPLQRTPGGDFGWVKKDYTDGSYSEDGATHGHNVVAPEYGYEVDPTNATAPGGSFPSNALGCASCHDPHGRARRLADGTVSNALTPIKASGSYPDAANEPTATEAVGVYRLLAGPGYGQTGTGITFTGAPAAKVPSSYNRTESAQQTRAAYGHATTKGHVSWGEWCATCHPNMHSENGYVHPVDETLGSVVANNYNQYVKTGDISGTATSSYTSLVPFVEGTADYTVLASHAKNDGTALGGPGANDRVSCLSCHRAHASGMMYALRYDVEYEFMTKEGMYIATDNPAVTGSRASVQRRGRSNAEWAAAYYDRPATQFASYQRVLCNKCHKKD